MFMRCKDPNCNFELCKLHDWAKEVPRDSPEGQRRTEVLYQAVMKHPSLRARTGLELMSALLGPSDKSA